MTIFKTNGEEWDYHTTRLNEQKGRLISIIQNSGFGSGEDKNEI